MTDGLENASKEWTRDSIRALVEQQTKAFSWTFMYMGADQDAIEVGQSLGIDRDHAVTYTRGKSRAAMAVASGKIAKLRRPGSPLPPPGWRRSPRRSARPWPSDDDDSSAVRSGRRPARPQTNRYLGGIRIPPSTRITSAFM